jgi:E3 ubiquitin-protein ligase NEDD4
LPYSRNYKQKYEFLRQQLKKHSLSNGKLEIKVRRSHILEDSYRFIMGSKLKLDSLRTKLWITFDGESGLDYGGIAREWFYAVTF